MSDEKASETTVLEKARQMGFADRAAPDPRTKEGV